MMIYLNGEPSETRGAETVSELVQAYGLQPAAVLIEHNGLALHRHEWPQKLLAAGDRIEFIRVVAGG